MDHIGHGGRKCEPETQTRYVLLTQTKLGNIFKSGIKLKVSVSSKNPLPKQLPFIFRRRRRQLLLPISPPGTPAPKTLVPHQHRRFVLHWIRIQLNINLKVTCLLYRFFYSIRIFFLGVFCINPNLETNKSVSFLAFFQCPTG